jgi:hypothetical protein
MERTKTTKSQPKRTQKPRRKKDAEMIEAATRMQPATSGSRTGAHPATRICGYATVSQHDRSSAPLPQTWNGGGPAAHGVLQSASHSDKLVRPRCARCPASQPHADACAALLPAVPHSWSCGRLRLSRRDAAHPASQQSSSVWDDGMTETAEVDSRVQCVQTTYPVEKKEGTQRNRVSNCCNRIVTVACSPFRGYARAE